MTHCGDGNSMENKLLASFRNELIKNKSLSKMKAEMRTKIIDFIRNGDKSPINNVELESQHSPTSIMNHLIVEYFQWMKYHFSKDMLEAEANSNNTQKLIEGIKQKFPNHQNSNSDTPLLLEIMLKAMNENKE